LQLSLGVRWQPSVHKGSGGSVLAFRAAVAATIPIATLLAYLGFGLYGIYLERKLAQIGGRERVISKETRWDSSLYPAEAAPWIARDRWWHRLRIVVWLGLVVVANGLYVLIKP
jgi:hypothetical protein